MLKRVTRSGLLVLVVFVAFLAGAWVSWRAAGGGASSGARKVLYYVDPMHPAYKSDKPGIAPDCGMQLEPVYADGGPVGGGDGGASHPAGTVQITPDKQQLIGVRVAAVEHAAGAQPLRLYGRVAPDETRVHTVNAGLEGAVRDTAPVTTGSRVRRGQLLATVFSQDARLLVQTYLGHLEAYERNSREGEESLQHKALMNITAERLRNFGYSDAQIDEINKKKVVPVLIRIESPAEGIVLSRNISAGQRFDKGFEWYRIADLRRVWILADVSAADAAHVRPGMTALVAVPGTDETLPARVADVLPQFDGATRTLKVRLAAENRDLALRPDMLVDVSLKLALPAGVTVPVDAIVDAGLHKTVFVERGNGYFEPRRVQTGWRSGDRVEIVKGLAPGERVVVSGTFLVDSESRLKAAAAGIYGEAAKDPVCGMDVDVGKARAAGKLVEHAGATHYFCSEACKHQFDASPAKYLAAAATPAPAAIPSTPAAPPAVVAAARDPMASPAATASPVVPAAQGAAAPEPAAAERKAFAKDPICGMDVDEKGAAAAGRTSTHEGRAHFFCSDQCKRTFDAEPHRFATTGDAASR